MKVKNDHNSNCSNLSCWKEVKKREKNSGLQREAMVWFFFLYFFSAFFFLSASKFGKFTAMIILLFQA